MKMKWIILTIFLLGIGLLSSFSEADKFTDKREEFIVVLDAGHGGHDPGNLGNGFLEKNIALNIVLKVGQLLKQDTDIKVIYTRNDDSFVDLFVRGEIANKANADLFVSVHCDSHTSDAHGAGTFVLGLHANKQNFEIAKKENSVIYLEDNYESRYAEYDINSPESVIGLTIMQEEFLDQSILLAKMMQDNFSGKLKRNDRKVKQAGFIVLHQTFMPSVLVEAGFLTYKPEGQYLSSQKGQSEMGKAIADAIMDYKKGITLENTEVSMEPVSFPTKTEESAEAVVNKKPTIPTNEDTSTEVVVVKDSPEEKVTVNETSQGATKGNPVKKDENNRSSAPDPVAMNKTETNKPVDVKVVATPKKAEEAEKDIKRTTEAIANKMPEEKKPVPPENKEEMKVENAVGIIFKVQLLASSKELSLVSENFNGLNRLSKEPYKNLFRYMYGSTISHTEAKLLKKNADVKGYPTSYIVAYKDGIRIPMKEALKYVSN